MDQEKKIGANTIYTRSQAETGDVVSGSAPKMVCAHSLRTLSVQAPHKADSPPEGICCLLVTVKVTAKMMLKGL